MLGDVDLRLAFMARENATMQARHMSRFSSTQRTIPASTPGDMAPMPNATPTEMTIATAQAKKRMPLKAPNYTEKGIATAHITRPHASEATDDATSSATPGASVRVPSSAQNSAWKAPPSTTASAMPTSPSRRTAR